MKGPIGRVGVPPAPAYNPRMPDQKAQGGDPGPGGAPGERIQKVMALAGVGSRRACEELVESGAVRVNGRVVTELPRFVDPSADVIEVKGRRLSAPERFVYVMLNKPRHTLSTVTDPDGRRTVTDLVRHPSGVRLYPVGRLDYDTMGLLLMTNDGPLSHALTHPSYGVHKTYRAVVKGAMTEDELAELERGVFLAVRREGRTVGAERTGGVGLKIVSREKERTVLDIRLREGRNRQVRRMLAVVGHRVKKLTRIEMGPIRLKGVQLGAWRELNAGEIRALRKAAERGARRGGGS